MHLVAAVIADEQPFEVMEPGEGALDDPARSAEPRAVLSLAAGDLRLDPAVAALTPVLVMVVAAIGGQPLRPPRGRPTLPLTGRVSDFLCERVRAVGLRSGF